MICFNGCKKTLNKFYGENLILECDNKSLNKIIQNQMNEIVNLRCLVENIKKSSCSKCVDPAKVEQAKKDIMKGLL